MLLVLSGSESVVCVFFFFLLLSVRESDQFGAPQLIFFPPRSKGDNPRRDHRILEKLSFGNLTLRVELD